MYDLEKSKQNITKLHFFQGVDAEMFAKINKTFMEENRITDADADWLIQKVKQVAPVNDPQIEDLRHFSIVALLIQCVASNRLTKLQQDDLFIFISNKLTSESPVINTDHKEFAVSMDIAILSNMHRQESVAVILPFVSSNSKTVKMYADAALERSDYKVQVAN